MSVFASSLYIALVKVVSPSLDFDFLSDTRTVRSCRHRTRITSLHSALLAELITCSPLPTAIDLLDTPVPQVFSRLQERRRKIEIVCTLRVILDPEFLNIQRTKVLLMTLQHASPELDYDRDKKFSKSFKEMTAMCLVKDQTKRPTAEKLLKHPFFKNAKPSELFVKSLIEDLPPLWDRVKALQLKDAEQLALKKIPSSEQEALSMSEYQRGVSAWNFDIEDLKVQASLIVDDENIVEEKEDDRILRNFINNKCEQEPSTSGSNSKKSLAVDKNSDRAEDENQLLAESSSHDAWKASNMSGSLILPNHASTNSLSSSTLSLRGYGDSPEDSFRSNVVQIKGRFSITSENIGIVKDSQLTRSASVADCLFNPKQVVKAETTERERLLLVKISELQASMISLTDQLTAARLKHTQLEQQLNTACLKRNGEEA